MPSDIIYRRTQKFSHTSAIPAFSCRVPSNNLTELLAPINCKTKLKLKQLKRNYSNCNQKCMRNIFPKKEENIAKLNRFFMKKLKRDLFLDKVLWKKKEKPSRNQTLVMKILMFYARVGRGHSNVT